MMNIERMIAEGLVEAYLLNMLPPDEKTAFEQLLPNEPRLREELLLQELLVKPFAEAPLVVVRRRRRVAVLPHFHEK